MFISDETQSLISELKEFSSSKIKNISDLSLLIEASKISSREKLFDDIIFIAKYLNGLGRILQGKLSSGFSQKTELNGGKERTINQDVIDKIKNEYIENLRKLNKSLKDLIENLEESSRIEFTAKYLSLSHESLANLTGLIYDLTWLKTFKNKRKEK